jgi:hypothetical protein
MSDEPMTAEARRAARKAEAAKAEAEQRDKDFAALDELEIKHGDSCVTHMDVPWSPGMPTMIIARKPNAIEYKRFQDRVKPKNGKAVPFEAQQAAARELTECTLLYPSKDVFAELAEQRPAIVEQLGIDACALAQASKADEGKG